MKRILAFFTILALALSCGKENETNGGGGGGGSKEVESVTIESASTIRISIENEAGRLLPVTVAPAGCTLNQVKVVVEKEGIIACSLGDGGVRVRPLSIGETKMTVAPKEGPGSAASVTVKVLSAEDYATLEISNIAMESTVTLREGESSIAAVTLTPAEATTDMLKWSGGEEYVTVSAVEGGLQFVPKKVGNTTVKVEAKKGSATAKTVTVEILDKNAYSEYVITDIKYSPSTVEVKDNGTTDITLTLAPEAATVTDLSVSSSDNTIAEVTKMGGKVLRITGKKAGNTKITVKGLRSGSKSIQIPVTVYGHVKGINITPQTGLEVVKGNKLKLTAVIETSGKLKSDEVEWSTDGDMLTLEPYNGSSEKSCSITGTKAGGASAPAKVTALLDDKSATVNFYVYDYPTGVDATFSGTAGTYEEESSAYSLKKGKSYTITWKVLPETAKQEGTVTFETSAATVSSKRSGSNWVTTISVTESSTAKNTFTISPANKNTGSKTYNKYIYLNDYLSSDIKPGDYVYYNSGTGRFNWSDGGLRCVKQYSVRMVNQARQSSLGTLIAQVYDENVPTGDAAFNALTKPGFANKNGAHACVLSIKLAREGENENTVEYWRWSKDKDNVYGMTDWNNGPYPLSGGEYKKDYSMKLNIIHYNSKSGDSHKIRPGYCVTSFDKVCFGDIGDVSKYGTYASLGHTGWMLPLRSSAEIIANYRGNQIYKEIFTKMENVSYTYVNPSTGTKTEMPTEYWTAEQCGSDEAYYFSFENASSSMHKAKDPGTDAYAKPYIRPILWL